MTIEPERLRAMQDTLSGRRRGAPPPRPPFHVSGDGRRLIDATNYARKVWDTMRDPVALREIRRGDSVKIAEDRRLGIYGVRKSVKALATEHAWKRQAKDEKKAALEERWGRIAEVNVQRKRFLTALYRYTQRVLYENAKAILIQLDRERFVGLLRSILKRQNGRRDSALYDRQRHRAARQRHRSQGLCFHCSNLAAPGHSYCLFHLRYNRDRARRLRLQEKQRLQRYTEEHRERARRYRETAFTL